MRRLAGPRGFGKSCAMNVAADIGTLYREEGRRVFATLVRLLGDFDRAEEALQDAFRTAIEQWPRDGWPANPTAWLVSTGRHKAIDAARRARRYDTLGDTVDSLVAEDEAEDEGPLHDDQLRLIFTCCHPGLREDARIALTLREVCGLTTEEIARAFLVPAPTLAQRIVRAKHKIRSARIPYEVPPPEALPTRLASVLRVLYLVFNEGYTATAGSELVRETLTQEAIRLGRLLANLLPEAEAVGLLALMLLHESRREARRAADGQLIPLEEQDRTRWQQPLIAEGSALVERALSLPRWGSYALQAAIAAVHAEASSTSATDWRQIVGLYDVLLQFDPSPVVALNRAVAIAMHEGPAVGLTLVEDLLSSAELQRYHLAHVAHAELCRRLGRRAEAERSYRLALTLTAQETEQHFITRRLRDLDGPA